MSKTIYIVWCVSPEGKEVGTQFDTMAEAIECRDFQSKHAIPRPVRLYIETVNVKD